MRRIQVLTLVAAMAVSTMAAGQGTGLKGEDVVQEVTNLKKQWAEAEWKHDISFLDKLFADDFVVGTSQGEILNKEQLLRRIKDPERFFDGPPNTDNIQVRVYGDVAIMTEHTTVSGQDHGKKFGGEFRALRIFVKQEGRWRAMMEQATRLKSESATSN